MPTESFGFFDDESQPSPLPASPEATAKSMAPPAAEANHEDDPQKSASTFLTFQVGEHTYATPLMSIQEIIEVPAFKPVPRTAPYLAGVFNLRGDVSGLIDLSKRLGYSEQSATSQKAVLVFQTQHGPLGAIVDTVCRVMEVGEQEIKVRSGVKARIAEKYLGGFIELQSELIVLINLQQLLNDDEFDNYEHVVKKAS
jgi:purine-binding chemotaxis protein CheW